MPRRGPPLTVPHNAPSTSKPSTDSEDVDTREYEDLFLTSHGHEEDSNEGILQFAANISNAPKMGTEQFRRPKPVRNQALASERQTVLKDPFVRETCQQLRIFRKKKIFYQILLAALHNKEFTAKYFHPTLPMFTKYDEQAYVLDKI